MQHDTTTKAPSVPTMDPNEVSQIEPFWIPLSDGVQLAARLWLPAGTKPAGAVIEWVPYRFRDITRGLDDVTGDHLATQGFAFLRIDVRGTGESGGVIHDEFEESQTDDLIEAIEWIAGQPWCNGSVGVRGYSWGGNAALYAADRRPEPLKAVIACCACGDRFTRDLHWHGGALGLTNIQWAAYYDTVTALPPTPTIAGDDWRGQWRDRLNAIGPTAATWTQQQRANDYWATSSPAARYSDISCPVYVIGGLLDGFVDEFHPLLSDVSGPRKGLLGAWGHTFPHDGSPGPAFDWLPEEVKWWRHWLLGEPTSVMDDDPIRIYVQDITASQAIGQRDVPGQWVTLASWPSPSHREAAWHLDPDGLIVDSNTTTFLDVPHDELVGLSWREWSASDHSDVALPLDQTADDSRSLTFDSSPLDEDLVIVGQPHVTIRVASDQEVAMLGVRLTQVDDSGASWPLSFGVLNLAHRAGSDRPEALTPNETYEVEVPMRLISQRVRAGARLRLAVSSSFWPIVMTAPRVASLRVEAGPASALRLPVLDDAPQTTPILSPEPVSHSEPVPVDMLQEDDGSIRISTMTPTSRQDVPVTGTVATYADKTTVWHGGTDSNLASWATQVERGLEWGDHHVKIVSTTELSAHPDHYEVTQDLVALENGETFWTRRHRSTIARDLT